MSSAPEAALVSRLEQIRQRCERATPGEWGFYARGKTTDVHVKGGKNVVQWTGFDDSASPLTEHRANAAFIAHARSDIPFLLETITSLLGRIAAAEAEIASLRK